MRRNRKKPPITRAAIKNTTPPVTAAITPTLGLLVAEPDPPAPVSNGNDPEFDVPAENAAATAGVPPVATTAHAST